MKENQTSTAFTVAKTIVQQTNRNLFLTGKAGTGKTTFLKHIKANTLKQLAVVAPTGVAAINAGGVTIHSFFGLPFTPFIPNAPHELIGVAGALDKNQLLARTKVNSQKKEIFQQLELLIIDEISMVRADVFDAIDTLLRHYRNNPNQAFGGVQIVCIGDMMQLPPVAKQEEWQVLSNIYRSVYFFDSEVFAKANMLCVELNTIYRQSDSQFINILNNIRNSEITEGDLQSLQALYYPNFSSIKNKGYITLTSHNAKAEEINTNQLIELQQPIFTFSANVEGDFDEKIYPNHYNLQLKLGAQIMFIKNDLEREKKYYNGKIATVTSINQESIIVTTEEQIEIEVPIYTWENIKYDYITATQKIEEKVIGSFKQYPIKLAWAITIHKSQGLTFTNIAIDAFNSFASGQVYVALSRCTNLNGIKLLSPINANSIIIDEHIKNFNQYISSVQHNVTVEQDVKQFIVENLIQVFCFNQLLKLLKPISNFRDNHHKLLTQETNTAIQNIQAQLLAIQTVAEKFHIQIQQLLFNGSIEEKITQERLIKAAHYFGEQLKKIEEETKTIIVNHKTKIIKDEFIPKHEKFIKDLESKIYLISYCQQGFVVEEFYKTKFNYKPSLQSKLNIIDELEEPLEADYNEKDLLKSLKEKAKYLAEKDGVELFMIAQQKTLKLMATYLPQTVEELLKIEGIGEMKAKKYGEDFLQIINAYCTKYHLKSKVNEILPKEKNVIGESAKISFLLYKDLLDIDKVAKERNFSPTTISGHLALFVATGELDVNLFVTKEKLDIILQAINEKLSPETTTKFTVLKEILGNDFSYDEIKMGFSYNNFLKNNSSKDS